jgi:hypothetical protein
MLVDPILRQAPPHTHLAKYLAIAQLYLPLSMYMKQQHCMPIHDEIHCVSTAAMSAIPKPPPLLPCCLLQVWDVKEQQSPLLSFDLGAAVGDAAWAPYSSSVFAAVTDDGQVHIFDLAQNRQLPLCVQKVWVVKLSSDRS